MTNEEAIKMFKAIIMAEIGRLPHHYDSEVDDVVYDDISRIDELLQLNKIVSKALKKANKYRWHDLRKNPDDLPEDTGYGESEYVLVMIGTPEWYNCEWAYYNHDKKVWSTHEQQDGFAWRYVEPFEKNKDDE